MNDSISEKLFKTTMKKRIPLVVNFEVTQKCNLGCIHCYHQEDCKNTEKEMSLSQIKKALDDLKENGVMFIILTGGEPFSRDDIQEILEYIKNKEFSLILFTNGPLVDEKNADILKGISPFSVHITVYSVDPIIHDKITKIKGSLERTLKGIKLIREKGIEPVIKCPVMQENKDYVDDVKRWADMQGLTVKIDPFITPCYTENAEKILSHRLSVKDIDKTVKKMGFCVNDFNPRKDLKCPAGKNTVTLDSKGNILPCVIWREKLGNILRKEFRDIWDGIHLDYTPFDECLECENLPYCGLCPGVAKIEGKRIFCEMAENTKKLVISGIS